MSTLTEVMKIIQDYESKGWRIEIKIIDQVAEGNIKDYDNYFVSPFTFTSYVYKPEAEDFEIELQVSYDSVSDLYFETAHLLKKGGYEC